MASMANKALEKPEPESHEESSMTVKPTKPTVSPPLKQTPQNKVDDYSDIVSGDDGHTFAGRVEQIKVRL